MGDFTPAAEEPESKVGASSPTSSKTQIPLQIDTGADTIVDDVYFLAPGEHPGLACTTTLLTAKNFRSWSQEILNCLRAKGKIGFINGKIPRPLEHAKEYSLWIKNDAMIVT